LPTFQSDVDSKHSGTDPIIDSGSTVERPAADEHRTLENVDRMAEEIATSCSANGMNRLPLATKFSRE
jgi:hypothetical protein